jgi:hypothetical protein
MGIATLRSSSEPMPPRPPMVTACVVADDLAADHDERFADDGVDLAGHDRRAGLDGGEDEFADAAAGPEPSQRMSLAILVRLTARVRRWPDAST